jgi:hypothetical protein
MKYLTIALLLFIGLGTQLSAQDTLTLKQLRERLINERANKTNKETKPDGKEMPKAENKVDERGPIKVEPLPDDQQTYGPFADYIEQAALQSVYLLDQAYLVTDEEGDQIQVDEDDYRPIKVGVVIGEKMLSLNSMTTPWRFDPDGEYDEGSLDEIYYRSVLDERAKWMNESRFVNEDAGTDGLVYYEGINVDESNLALIDGRDSKIGILLLLSVNKGDDPRDAEVKKSYLEFEPDWNGGLADVELPKNTDLVIGGVYFNINTEAGKINFQVAGLMEHEDDRFTLHATSLGKKSGG